MMSRIDAAAALRLGNSWPLMLAAGRAVAEDILAHVAPSSRILVLAGGGNNGGDGFVAAHFLRQHGFRVAVFSLKQPIDADGDAARARALWGAGVHDIADCCPASGDVVIDALFGAGFHGTLPVAAAAVIARCAAVQARIWAIDIPSGIVGDSGLATPGHVVAARTITFGCLKPGHVLYPGRAACGVIRVADIGWLAADCDGLAESEPGLALNHPHFWQGALRAANWQDHKYSRGLMVVYGGPMPGAAHLAARAGLAVGAGYVLLSTRGARSAEGALPDSIVVRPRGANGWADLLADPRLSAVVLGPGSGVCEAAELALYTTLQRRVPCVLDGDILSVLAGDGALRALLGPHCVLTPHAGEWQRLSHAAGLDELSRLEKIRAFVAQTGAVLVVKGPDTLIAAPGREMPKWGIPKWGIIVDGQGHPGLARAGTGDVLAGMIGGLMAQGMSPHAAACCAVWHHGRAAHGQILSCGADSLLTALAGIQKLY